MPIQKITTGLISEICDKYPELAVLNLSDNEICEIENLEPLRSLTRLNLSGNRITTLKNLSSLVAIVELKAARNAITSIDLRGLDSLKTLDLSENCIEAMAQIRNLSHLRNLNDLSLQDNPICDSPGYAADVFQALPNLSTLDRRTASEWRSKPEQQQQTKQSAGGAAAQSRGREGGKTLEKAEGCSGGRAREGERGHRSNILEGSNRAEHPSSHSSFSSPTAAAAAAAAATVLASGGAKDAGRSETLRAQLSSRVSRPADASASSHAGAR
eukprot:1124917-Rhodomonas_salina.1